MAKPLKQIRNCVGTPLCAPERIYERNKGGKHAGIMKEFCGSYVLVFNCKKRGNP